MGVKKTPILHERPGSIPATKQQERDQKKLEELSTAFIEHNFHLASDDERGLVEIVYKCLNPECGDTQTLRYFRSDIFLASTCCVKCGGGFGNNPGGMFPLVGDEAAVN
jgi:hypothetical protein